MSACDGVYDVYRDMCRAAKSGTILNADVLLEQFRAHVSTFDAAGPRVVNDNA